MGLNLKIARIKKGIKQEDLSRIVELAKILYVELNEEKLILEEV